jgi:hypothetical protein
MNVYLLAILAEHLVRFNRPLPRAAANDSVSSLRNMVAPFTILLLRLVFEN